MWYDLSRLSIQTFHSSASAVVSDTTTSDDPCILLLVINGDPANCRSSGVRFVRVQFTLDFCPLVGINPPGNTILWVSYYLELPQSTVAMQDQNGNPHNLTTFHNVADIDIRTIAIEDAKVRIIEPCLQTSPIALQQPVEFNLQDTVTDETGIGVEIDKKIKKLSWNQINLHLHLC